MGDTKRAQTNWNDYRSAGVDPSKWGNRSDEEMNTLWLDTTDVATKHKVSEADREAARAWYEATQIRDRIEREQTAAAKREQTAQARQAREQEQRELFDAEAARAQEEAEAYERAMRENETAEADAAAQAQARTRAADAQKEGRTQDAQNRAADKKHESDKERLGKARALQPYKSYASIAAQMHMTESDGKGWKYKGITYDNEGDLLRAYITALVDDVKEGNATNDKINDLKGIYEEYAKSGENKTALGDLATNIKDALTKGLGEPIGRAARIEFLRALGLTQEDIEAAEAARTGEPPKTERDEPLTIERVRAMTPEDYQRGPTARQVVQVMKDAGLSKEEAIKELARLSATSSTGAISQIGMGALNSIYGTGREVGKRHGGGDDMGMAMAQGEPSKTPIKDEILGREGNESLRNIEAARQGIGEELLANADDPKLREAVQRYVDDVRKNYQDIEPETRRLVYMNMFDAYSKGFWGDPKSDDPQERKEAKKGLTFAIIGQLGKILAGLGRDIGKIGGHDIGRDDITTPFDTIQQRSIEQAMDERQTYLQGQMSALMSAAGYGPELQKEALEAFARWKNDPAQMPLQDVLKGTKKVYAFELSRILGEKLMKEPNVAELVGLLALGEIDSTAVKAILTTRAGQEVINTLKEWAEANPDGFFSGWIGGLVSKAANVMNGGGE